MNQHHAWWQISGNRGRDVTGRRPRLRRGARPPARHGSHSFAIWPLPGS